jgi:hypothetical protein
MTDVADPNAQDIAQQHIDVDNESVGTSGTDERSPAEKKEDAELAERLSSIIEDANSRVIPLCKMIRKVCIVTWRNIVNRSPVLISFVEYRKHGSQEGR